VVTEKAIVTKDGAGEMRPEGKMHITCAKGDDSGYASFDAVQFKGATAGMASSSPRFGPAADNFNLLWRQALRRIICRRNIRRYSSTAGRCCRLSGSRML